MPESIRENTHTDSKERPHTSFKGMLNRLLVSCFTLILAFIATNLLFQFLTYSFASSLGYEAKISYNEVLVPMDFHIWTRVRVMEVNFLPPFMCLLLGLGIYWVMSALESPWKRLHLFAYWLMICLINVFFSQLLFAPLGVADESFVFYQTFARIALWLHIPGTLTILFSLIAIGGSFAAGYFICLETIKLSQSYRVVNDSLGKNVVVFQFCLLPLLLSSVPLMMLAKGFTALRMGAILINLFLFPMGMFLRNSLGHYMVVFKKVRIGERFPVAELILSLSAWLIVYLFFR